MILTPGVLCTENTEHLDRKAPLIAAKQMFLPRGETDELRP